MASRRRVKNAMPAAIPARCRQGKVGFTTRSDAKVWKRARGLHELRPYSCPEVDCNLIHLGHLPECVITGEVGRDEMKPRSKPRPPRETYNGTVVHL